MTWAHVTLGSNPSAPTMSFIKLKEDFICQNCKKYNEGNGYTNHCSFCLYSLHVDIDPGDRLSLCHGLMQPIYVNYTEKDKKVLHKCFKCGLEKYNKLQSNDCIDTLITIASKYQD